MLLLPLSLLGIFNPVSDITIDPVALGGGIATLACFIWGSYERWRNSKSKEHHSLVDAEQRLTQTYKEECIALEKRYDREHQEFLAAREKYHSDRNEWTTLMGALQEQVGTLSAKTDITVLLKFQEQQSRINEQVISALQHITTQLAKLTPPPSS